MLFRQYVPGEPLAVYAAWFWFYEELDVPHRREHVLRDGTFELIIDLQDERRRLLGRRSALRLGIPARMAVPSSLAVHRGRCASWRLHDRRAFQTGGAAAVLGLPADELRREVVQLDAIWGAAASYLPLQTRTRSSLCSSVHLLTD